MQQLPGPAPTCHPWDDAQRERKKSQPVRGWLQRGFINKGWNLERILFHSVIAFSYIFVSGQLVVSEFWKILTIFGKTELTERRSVGHLFALKSS